MNKKILIVTALTGFVRAFLLDDIKILQDMGYQVECAANGLNDSKTLEENFQFFKDINVKFYQTDFSSNQPLSKGTLKASKEFSKIIKDNNYDAVHIHTPIPGVVCRLKLMFKRKNTKVLYTTHGFYFHKKSSRKNWFVFYNIEKFMSRLSDCIITINNEDYNNAKKMHCKKVYKINGVGVNTEKYINTVVDTEEYRKKLGLKDNQIAIVQVGELSNRKNHQVIIRAINKLNNKDLVYVVCGVTNESSTYSGLKKLAKSLNVDVRFLGYRTDIPEILKSCDIGAIPSFREGLGLAGIEMLASGLPIVASNVHGIVDYAIDGKTGYTADPYSCDDFANAIEKLLDKETRESMKDNCINKAKQFDMTVSHKQRYDIYKEILG